MFRIITPKEQKRINLEQLTFAIILFLFKLPEIVHDESPFCFCYCNLDIFCLSIEVILVFFFFSLSIFFFFLPLFPNGRVTFFFFFLVSILLFFT